VRKAAGFAALLALLSFPCLSSAAEPGDLSRAQSAALAIMQTGAGAVAAAPDLGVGQQDAAVADAEQKSTDAEFYAPWHALPELAHAPGPLVDEDDPQQAAAPAPDGTEQQSGDVEPDGAVLPAESADVALEQDGAPPRSGDPQAELLEADAGAARSSCGCSDCAPCSKCRGCTSCCDCRSGTIEFFGPMAVLNQHPPALLTLQPEPDVATVLEDGESFFRYKLDITNVFLRELDSGVIVDYDYEELRSTLDYTLGSFGGEFSVELPISQRGGGFLDELIDSWHQWFGLQSGIRANFPDNGFRYIIATREGPVYNGEESFGIGDLALTYKFPLMDDGAGDALAVRAGVKLPTGDPDQALGSGNVDYSLGALWQKQITPHIRGYANVDYIFVGEPDWENIGWQDSLITAWALEYAIKRHTSLTALFRTHRNPLRTGSNQGDKDSQTLGLGLNHRLADDLVLTAGFDEDINPETAPDFIAVLHLKWEF
jgi:hypothetical protein